MAYNTQNALKRAAIALLLICAAVFAQPKDSFTDPRDSKTYKTVKIGAQTWMAENLNYKAEGSTCYDNDESNCQKYGRLYDWNTAMKACPSGWHLPSDSEWEKFGFLDLPGGYGNSHGRFYNVGGGGTWWSANEVNSDVAHSRIMAYNYENVYWYYDKSFLFSVRCLQGY